MNLPSGHGISRTLPDVPMTTTQGDAAGSTIPVSSSLGALTTATGGGLGTPERVLVLCPAVADVKVPPSSWQPLSHGRGRKRQTPRPGAARGGVDSLFQLFIQG